MRKHRATLQRHIKDGTLTVERDATNNSVIDVSELQRVYGTVHVATDEATGATVPQKRQVQQFDAPHYDSEIKLLKLQLEVKDREIAEAQRREREERDRHQETKEEKARLFDMLEQAQKTIATLPAQNPESAISVETSKQGFWKRIFG